MTTTTTIATWGLADGELLRRVEQLGLCDAEVGVALLPDDGRTKRLRLQAADTGRLAWAEALVRAHLGDAVLGGPDATLEGAVVDLLARQGLCVGTAESLTAGDIASRLSEPPDSSDVFLGGVVSYASRVKYQVLGVPEGPVVTGEAAAAMAEGACRVLGVDCAVSATGVAGPAEMEGQPVGTVFIGSCVDGASRAVFTPFDGDRESIRRQTVAAALNELRLRLLARERGQDLPTTSPSPGAEVVIDLADPVPDPV